MMITLAAVLLTAICVNPDGSETSCRTAGDPLRTATAGFSLFVSSCLDGTLHGKPTKVCQEHPIRHYETIERCNAAVKAGTVTDWINMMAVVGIHVDVRSYRCGPAEADGDDI